MSAFEQAMSLLESKFGQGRDNVLALATVDTTPATGGRPRPVVRDVDAYYADGVFYAVTWATSGKMRQIAANPNVAIAVCGEWFNGSAVAEDLGWVLDPGNAGLRSALREAFAAWYDVANDESNPDCHYLALRLTTGVLNLNHFEKVYHLDFAARTATVTGAEAT